MIRQGFIPNYSVRQSPQGSLVRFLARMPNANNGTTLGGLAEALKMGLMGYQQNKDEQNFNAAQKALLEGMSAKPWQNPDAGPVEMRGPGGELMHKTTLSNPRPEPVGGIEGALTSLSKLEGNPYAGRLTQQLLSTKMQMDEDNRRLQEQRAYDANMRKEDRAFDMAKYDLTRKDRQSDLQAQREYQANLLKAQREFDMQRYGLQRQDQLADTQAKQDFEMRKLEALGNVDMRKAFDKMLMEDQMARARIDYEKGMGGGSGPDGTVQVSEAVEPTVGALGVPFADTDPLADLPISERGKAARNIREQTIKDFAASREAVDQARNVHDRLGRFVTLLDQGLDTGAQYSIPGAQGLMSGIDSQVSEAKSIVDMMTPMMRQGMPGAASDRDVAMFRGATVGLDKPEGANRNIAAGLMASRENIIARDEFMQAYFDQNKHLQGADRAWNKYLDANPIFDPKAEKGTYKLNSGRQSWMEYFANPGAASAPKSDFMPTTAKDMDDAPVGTTFIKDGAKYTKMQPGPGGQKWAVEAIGEAPSPAAVPGASGIR